MTDTAPDSPRRGPRGAHGRALLAWARRPPPPAVPLDQDEARVAGLVGIDRARRPHPRRAPWLEDDGPLPSPDDLGGS